jgi:hypothetical protein
VRENTEDLELHAPSDRMEMFHTPRKSLAGVEKAADRAKIEAMAADLVAAQHEHAVLLESKTQVDAELAAMLSKYDAICVENETQAAAELEATHLKHAAELLESETNLTDMLLKLAKEMEDVKYKLHDTLKTLDQQAATLQHANAWTTQSRRNSEQFTIQKQKLMAEIATW